MLEMKLQDSVRLKGNLIRLVMDSGIKLTIINDLGKIYSPVMDFLIFTQELEIHKRLIISSIFASIILNSNYYNPLVSKWEPIIENF